jgi:hypothetical protein
VDERVITEDSGRQATDARMTLAFTVRSSGLSTLASLDACGSPSSTILRAGYDIERGRGLQGTRGNVKSHEPLTLQVDAKRLTTVGDASIRARTQYTRREIRMHAE